MNKTPNTTGMSEEQKAAHAAYVARWYARRDARDAADAAQYEERERMRAKAE